MIGRILAIGILATLFFLGAYIANGPGEIVALVAYVVFAIWRGRQQRALWTLVWRLRQANVEDRAAIIAATAQPKLRKKVQEILARDGTNEIEGDTERFPFPLGLRRGATRAYWMTWALGIIALITLSTVPRSLPGLRYFLLGILGFCVYAAWSALRRERSYDSIIEVTPFRLSELLPNGQIRSLSLRGYLVVRHEPKRRRLRISPNDHDPGIILDFRRMGFDRLLDLIAEYGRFRRDEGDETSPAS